MASGGTFFKMKQEDKKNILVIATMIFLLISLSFWRGSNKKEIDYSAYEVPSYIVNEIRRPSFDLSDDDVKGLVSGEINFEDYLKKNDPYFDENDDIKYQEKIIDNKIKIKYPDFWSSQLVGSRNVDDSVSILFVTSSADLNNAIILSVFEINPDEKNFESALSLFSSFVESQGSSVNYSKKEEIDYGYCLESKYNYNNETVYSKEKLIFIDNKFYLVSVLNLNIFSEKNKLISENIINSLQII